MALLKTLSNNYYSGLSGKVLKTPLPPRLVFKINSNRFLPASVNPWLRFTTSRANTIYVDFGDGSPIFSAAFTGTYQFSQSSYTYTHSAMWPITIWFEYPTAITEIDMFRCQFIGEFPSQIGLYNLSSLVVRFAKFDSFPTDLAGGVFDLLHLDNLTSAVLYSIPGWILSSRISRLGLTGGFDFSTSSSNLSQLVNLQGLTELYLNANKLTKDNMPAEIGVIPLLKRLVLGDNPITEINSTINNYRQIERLEFGYEPFYNSGYGSPISNWGVGIANMTNLKLLNVRLSGNIPATLPVGLESAPLCKSIMLDSCYRTTQRVDQAINEAYDRVVAGATITNANTTMRNIQYHIGWLSKASGGAPPSGIYQAPSGYVQGVSNGSPANPLEKVYVLVKQYGWRITTVNQELTANIIYS